MNSPTVACTMASPKAIEAANAVSTLLHLVPNEQQTCLAAIEEFLTSAEHSEDCEPQSLDTETEFDVSVCECTLKHSYT